MNKYVLMFLCILVFVTGCKSGQVVVDASTSASMYIQRYMIASRPPLNGFRKKGFRYRVPEGMTESPGDAYRYKYDNLILDKGSDYFSSSVVIAIRHYDLNDYENIDSFSANDQKYLVQSVNPVYENNWKAEPLLEKNITHKSYQFSYKVQKSKIYQRSVYILCDNVVHIVSLSSFYKELLNRPEAESFWETVRID